MMRLKAYSGAVIAMIFWSLSFIWYKEAFLIYGPATTIFLRLVISGSLLWVLTFAFGKFQRIEKGDLIWFLFLAFLEPFLYFVGESYGVARVSSTLASLIISTIPLFTVVVSVIFLKERFLKINIVGIAISILGVYLVLLSQNIDFKASIKGVSLLMLSVFSAIGYAFVIKRLTMTYNTMMIVSMQNSLGAIYFLPLFLSLEFKDFISVTPTFSQLLPIFELAVFASTIAFIGFTYSIKKIGVAHATLFVNMIPAFTAIAAYFMLNESMPIIKVTGILITIFGLFISQYQPQKAHLAVETFG